MSQLHPNGAVFLFCGKQAKHESILRLEKVAFCLLNAITKCLVLCCRMQGARTYTACPIG